MAFDSSYASVVLPNEEATVEWGRKISSQLKPGDIVKITGPFGAGKTTLVRGIVEGFGGDSTLVHSPTFALVHQYDCPSVSINHCDFYRLEQDSQLDDFGGLEFFSDPYIYLIEWPERIVLFNSTIRNRLFHLDLQHDGPCRIFHYPAVWKNLD